MTLSTSDKRNDYEVLSITLETLDHGGGLAAAAGVVTNGDTGLHVCLLNAKRPEADKWPPGAHKALITFGYSTSALTHERQRLLWGALVVVEVVDDGNNHLSQPLSGQAIGS